MKQLQALLYKEWRDQRVFCIASLAACLLLSLAALRINGAALMKHSMYVDSVLPASCMIFAMVLATESIARDAQSRVADTLLRLPASRFLAWTAKFLFVLCAVVALVALLLPLDFLLGLASTSGQLAGDQVLVRPQFWSFTAALAAAGFALACVLRRALPAAIVGTLSLAALPFLPFAVLPFFIAGGLEPCRVWDWNYVYLSIFSPQQLAGFGAAGFLLGSLLAFSIRHNDPLGWRRGLAVMGSVAFVLGLAAAGSLRRALSAFDIPFGDADAWVVEAVPSPDGRFLAVQMHKDCTVHPDWLLLGGTELSRTAAHREVWLYDRSDKTWSKLGGTYHELLTRFRRGFSQGPWDARGRLSVLTSPSAFGQTAGGVQLIDPKSRAVLLAPPIGISMFDRLEAETGLGTWYTTVSDSKRSVLTLHWNDSGIEWTIPDDLVFVVSPEPGVVFLQRDHLLVRHDMRTGSEHVLRRLERDLLTANIRVSPDGRHVSTFSDGTTTILDALDGHSVAELPIKTWLACWSDVPGRLCWYVTGFRERALILHALDELGRSTALPTTLPSCGECGADRLVQFDSHRIECMKLDGSERETLYEAKP